MWKCIYMCNNIGCIYMESIGCMYRWYIPPVCTCIIYPYISPIHKSYIFPVYTAYIISHIDHLSIQTYERSHIHHPYVHHISHIHHIYVYDVCHSCVSALPAFLLFWGLLPGSGATCTTAYGDKIRYCKTFQTGTGSLSLLIKIYCSLVCSSITWY